MSEKKMVEHFGSCNCGKVKFKVNLDQIPRVYNCHCIDCRKTFGGMITIIDIRKGALILEKKNLGTFTQLGGSGKEIKNYYCKTCTAPILRHVSLWKRDYLFAGLLDNIDLIKKVTNIFYKNAHFPFMKINDEKLIT